MGVLSIISCVSFPFVLFSFLGKSTEAKNLVLIGGGLSDDSQLIWNKIVELAGGVGVARIGIITAASADPIDSADYYEEMFARYGALETYFVPVYEGNKEANSQPEVVDNIRRMSGFMFGGGDQARVISSFYNDNRTESPALAAIRSTYEDDDAVIAGSSAGIACQPWAVMIMGGWSWEGLAYGAFPFGEEIDNYDLIYDPDGGILMLNKFIIDSHFSERGREGRLVRLIWDTKDKKQGVQFGIGVDEDTAIVITDADTTMAVGQVIGIDGAMIIDLSNAEVDENAAHFHIEGVRAHYLTHGDQIDLTTLAVNFDTSWKSDMRGQERILNAATSDDIFYGWRSSIRQAEFVRVATSLFDALLDNTTSGTTYEDDPMFKVTMTQDELAQGYGGYSPLDGVFRICYSGLLIEIGEA